MSEICTEAGLGPGCSRIKHLSQHSQTLVKEAMLLPWIVEKFYYFCLHCMQTFFFPIFLTELGILWQNGSCNLFHFTYFTKLHSSFELPKCVSFLFWKCILVIFSWFSLMSLPLASFWSLHNDKLEQLMQELKRRSSGKFWTITFLQCNLSWNLYYHSPKKKQLSYLRGFRLAGWSISSTNNAILAKIYTLKPYYHDVHLLILTFDHIQEIILKLFLMNVVHACCMVWSCKPLLVRVVSCLQRFSRMAHMQYNPDYPNVRGDIG